MTAQDVTRILDETGFFTGLDPDALKNLASGCSVRTLSPREALFHEGAEGAAFFILLSGSIKVYKLSPDGRETVIKNVKPGELFGEAILFGDVSFPASGVATAESRVLLIRKEHFRRVLDNPAARDGFIGSVLAKLRYLTARMHYLITYDVEERFFLYLADHYGRHEEYHVDLSKKDFASAIGTIPETMSRLIQRLTERGDMRWVRSKLTLRKGFWKEWGER